MLALSLIEILTQIILLDILHEKIACLAQLVQLKIVINKNWVYSGYGIAFDGKGAWSFVNDYAWNLLIFGGDNSS